MAETKEFLDEEVSRKVSCALMQKVFHSSSAAWVHDYPRSRGAIAYFPFVLEALVHLVRVLAGVEAP